MGKLRSSNSPKGAEQKQERARGRSFGRAQCPEFPASGRGREQPSSVGSAPRCWECGAGSAAAAGPDRARLEARELKGDLVAGCDSLAFRVGKIEGSSKGQEGAREEAARKVSVRSPCEADSLNGKAGIQGGGP